MARYGFIHDKLDIKFLILYFMARVAAPIDFPTLTELTSAMTALATLSLPRRFLNWWRAAI